MFKSSICALEEHIPNTDVWLSAFIINTIRKTNPLDSTYSRHSSWVRQEKSGKWFLVGALYTAEIRADRMAIYFSIWRLSESGLVLMQICTYT